MIVFDKRQNFFYSNKINDDNFFSGFGTKKTPYEEILPLELLKSHWQTHSTNIEYVKSNTVSLEDTDGFITREKNIFLIAKTADCVPIIFTDKINQVIGISHQGWKGTLNKMTTKMVEAMIDYGAEVSRLQIVIGPAICKKCYCVSAELYAIFAKTFSLKEKGNHLDLKQINYQQLLNTGLKPEQIEISTNCTYCEKEFFYSCRRDGKEKEERMTSFIINK